MGPDEGDSGGTLPGELDGETAAELARQTAVMAGAARAARDEAEAAGSLVWDPYDPTWAENPYPIYDRLRAANPVHRSPLGFWVFTRHADCLAILRDRRSSSDARNADPTAFPDARLAEIVSGAGAAEALEEMAPFLFRDPPDHTRLRGLVQKAFTPRVVEGLRPRVEEICEGLLDEALDRGTADLVADYAYPLPVQLIAELLGVPAEDQVLFKEWSDALARGLDPDFLLPPEAIEERLTGILNFAMYFSTLIEDRRSHPGPDLLTSLIQAEEAGQVLSQAELLSTCILLLVAGHETTVNLISGGALALLEHPSELARFRSDPGLSRSGVEEMLRYCGPIQLTGRALLEPMEIGGVELAQGDFALLLVASANRDPEAFPDPDKFDVGRTENNHLGFGFGIHHCLGAPLARLETQVALAALLRRAGTIEPSTDRFTYKENIVLRGLDSLPVTLSA